MHCFLVATKGKVKGSIKIWIVLFFSHFAFGIPVQVIFRSSAWVFGCGIHEAAAAFSAVNVEKAAFLTAAALVYFLACAEAAGCESMCVSAAAGIMCAIEGACSLGEPYVLLKYLLLGSFVTVPAQFLLVSAAAAASGCMSQCQSAAAGMPQAIVGKFTLGSFFQCVVVNDDVTIINNRSRFASVQVEASPRVDVDEAPQAEAASEFLLASSGHVWTEFRGLPGPGENFQRVEEEGRRGGGKSETLDSFFVFVVSLGGSSVQVRVEGSDSYESLAAKVAAKVNIPECHWYLTFLGKDLRHASSPNLCASP